MRSFVLIESIDLNDITNTPYSIADNQLGNEVVDIGEEARKLVDSLCEEGMVPEVNVFFYHVRLFYTTLGEKLIQKFPFNSTFLSDLRVLNPSERLTFKDFPNAIVRFAKILPQLQLCGDETLDILKTEAIDFQMSEEDDLPTETDVDSFWASMHQVKHIASSLPVYPNLLVLVRALLSLPASNADSKRCFSMVRFRGKESFGTYNSWSTSFNEDGDCFDFKPQ